MLVHMDITPYVDSLRRDLVAAAESGSDDVKAAAERLAMALDPSARLALMEALSHAAAEITAELPAGSVDVRLNGRELDFVVQNNTAQTVLAAYQGSGLDSLTTLTCIPLDFRYSIAFSEFPAFS